MLIVISLFYGCIGNLNFYSIKDFIFCAEIMFNKTRVLKAYNSVVECAAHNGLVAGSNPARPIF